jgi:hypothetical protein
MTMANGECEVCHVNPPIGVASTLMPYSCAYCRECATRGAQPLEVFECLYDEYGTDFDRLRAEVLVMETFAEGRYVEYKTWATRHP